MGAILNLMSKRCSAMGGDFSANSRRLVKHAGFSVIFLIKLFFWCAKGLCTALRTSFHRDGALDWCSQSNEHSLHGRLPALSAYQAEVFLLRRCRSCDVK